MIDAVIFDLFDTLIHLPRDTNPYLQLCRAIGATTRIRESLVVDAPSLADFCDYLQVSHPSTLGDIQQELDADIGHAAIFSDSLPTLRSLRDRGLKTALISNLASPYKRAVTQLELESWFDVIVYSCDVGIAKPNPRIYLDALTKLGSTAEKTVMVGDSLRSDVDGPKSVGIQGLLIDRNGRNSDGFVIHALTDIIPIVGS